MLCGVQNDSGSSMRWGRMKTKAYVFYIITTTTTFHHGCFTFCAFLIIYILVSHIRATFIYHKVIKQGKHHMMEWTTWRWTCNGIAIVKFIMFWLLLLVVLTRWHKCMKRYKLKYIAVIHIFTFVANIIISVFVLKCIVWDVYWIIMCCMTQTLTIIPHGHGNQYVTCRRVQ